MEPRQLIVLALLSCFRPVMSAPRILGRVYKPGKVVLGNLLSLYGDENCTKLYLPGLTRILATIYAIERINEDQNLLRNVTLGYDIRDYCGSRALAMANTFDFVTNRNLLDDQARSELYNSDQHDAFLSCQTENSTSPIVAIVGPYGSRNSLQVAGLLQVVDMAAISPSATSEELSWPFYSSFFRTVPNDGYQAKAMASLIEYFNWTYVAAIAVEHSYGLYGIRALERESFQNKKFCIAFVEYLPPSGYENHLAPTIAKLKRSPNIKVVLLWIGDTLAADLIREAKRQGLYGRVWLMSDSLATKTPAFLGSDLEFFGVYIGVQPRRHRDDDFDKHLKSLTARKSLEIGGDWWDQLWINEYKCSANPNSSHGKTCPENLTITENTLQKMHDGFVPYHIDAISAVAHALGDIYRCGQVDQSDGYPCPQTDPFVKPKDVLSYLRKVRFKGLTGQIAFDEYGDSKEAAYDIITFQLKKVGSQLEHTKETLGTWDRDNLLDIKPNVIKWNGSHKSTEETTSDATAVPKSVCQDVCPPGMRQTDAIACCWECIECPDGTMSDSFGSKNCSKCSQLEKSNEGRTACVDLPVLTLQWSDLSAIVLAVMASFGLACTGFATVVFASHLETPLVKASNRELSFFLLLEIFFSFVLSLVLISEPTTVTCLINEPWRYITHTATVTILLLKTVRLLKVFQITAMAKWFKSYCNNYKKQLAAVCAITTVEFCLVVLWYIFDPPHVTLEVTKNEHVLLLCKSYGSNTGLAFQIMVFCYFFLLSALCTFYAFKARNLPENFSEAKYIGFSMYILLLSWISYLPVHYSLVGWYTTVVSCGTLLLSSYGLLFCMFLPKVYVVLRYPEQNTVEFVRAELRTINRIGPISLAKSSVGNLPESVAAPWPYSVVSQNMWLNSLLFYYNGPLRIKIALKAWR